MTKRLFLQLPDERQELLLKACLFNGVAAIDSWRAWQSLIDVEDIDVGSQRLLPLAYQNLSAQDVAATELERYRGVARYIWYDNHRKMLQTRAVLDAFAEAQIPVMLLKGLALVPLYYRNWALRPTNDLDLMVPPQLAGAAGEVLERNGWRSGYSRLLKSAAYRTTIHAMSFVGEAGDSLDLHWHALLDWCSEDADTTFWEAAQVLPLNGCNVLALGDTDQFFQIIVHTPRRDPIAPIRWVADATMLLRVANVDWDRLLALIAAGGFVLRARQALSYLRDVFYLAVPDRVLRELGRATPSAVETLEARINRLNMPRLIWQACFRYAHYRRNRRWPAAPRNFPSYLRTTWGGETWVDTLRAVAVRLPRYFSA